MNKLVECDVCGELYPADSVEGKQFVNYRATGTSESVFGEGNNIECDICETCMYSTFANYMRITNLEI